MVTGQQAINYGNPEGVDLFVTRRNYPIARAIMPSEPTMLGGRDCVVLDADNVQLYTFHQDDVRVEQVFNIANTQNPLFYSFLWWVNAGQTETNSNEELVTADNRETSVC